MSCTSQLIRVYAYWHLTLFFQELMNTCRLHVYIHTRLIQLPPPHPPPLLPLSCITVCEYGDVASKFYIIVEGKASVLLQQAQPGEFNQEPKQLSAQEKVSLRRDIRRRASVADFVKRVNSNRAGGAKLSASAQAVVDAGAAALEEKGAITSRSGAVTTRGGSPGSAATSNLGLTGSLDAFPSPDHGGHGHGFGKTQQLEEKYLQQTRSLFRGNEVCSILL